MARHPGSKVKEKYYHVNEQLPQPYDLCILVDKNEKTCMGWRINNTEWDGYHIDKMGKIIAWKKKFNE